MWSQWNGRYRDTIQRYLRGDAGMAGAMAACVSGSADLFPDSFEESRRPYQSINYFSSHDGFSLYDLVSYDRKNNWANGEENRDGADCYSWNCGHEGDDGAPENVLSLRRRQMKNFILLLMVSNGIPMFRMGDEFAQTQGGNNNPWNQDNETAWLDWDRLERFAGIHRFMKSAIAFRKAHPTLCRPGFWRDDVAWYGAAGPHRWLPEDRSFAFYLDGRRENDRDLYLMSNAWREDMTFRIAEPGPWRVVADTARESPGDFWPEGDGPPVDGGAYEVKARSTVLLIRAPRTWPPRAAIMVGS
jgi:glycogen operon protein